MQSYDAEKYRNIYGAIVRYMGEKRDVKQLWSLPTDNENQVTKEYIDKRNKDAIIIAEQLGIINAEC